ncbi:hypothetical protein OH491_25235 [Termitidicoccus mucosus]|uniref:GH16 domain-containing protein n=1 Tax=Termitidicoccus mucosus TaxID=1184151 RepID=A0A178IPH8_9BACT|nr:hypothetical protein AW736_01310 [Opitutaceae bacterium TSB47]
MHYPDSAIIGSILALGLSFSASAPADTPLPSSAPLNEPFALVFADEFNGDRLDETVWVSQAYETAVKNDTARGPGNLEVRGGELLLHVRKESREIRGRATKWTSGYVYTREPVGTNVYVEARFKSGQCPGVNNAFWLAAVSEPGEAGLRDRYEIDIVEARKDMRVPDAPGALNGYGHLAWHDWKTMAYAKNAAGGRDHIAQGSTVPHTFGDYHIWGLWLGEDEQIFYLDGREVWRGSRHPRYKDQWRTGTGKFKQWFPDREKEAYGRFGQDDWNYLGGYAGDKLNIIFANLPWGDKWTPLGDEADGTFMAVDYVRVYKPTRLVTKTPAQLARLAPDTGGGFLPLPAHAAKTIPLATPVPLDSGQPAYFSLVLRKSAGAAPRLTWLDADGNPVASAGIDAAGHLIAALGDSTPASTQTAWPAREQKAPLVRDDADHLLVVRLTPARDGGPPAISLCAFPLDRSLPKDEPFFHANITATGDTSLNNHWHLNQKHPLPEHARATSVRVENASDTGSIQAAAFRAGPGFPSVLP